MINLGDPFISPNSTVKDLWDEECSPLICLASLCGLCLGGSIQTVDKAILLLQRKADILYRDYNDDTVLHRLLETSRYREMFRPLTWNQFYWSLAELEQLLMVFIIAGADVYAFNNRGETPSMIARKYGREVEWTESLTLCGYDSEEVFAQSDPALHDCTRIPQTSKLSFEEFCWDRQEHLRYKALCFGEYCQGCGDKFLPEMISFEERCEQCGGSFQAKEVSLEGRYQVWRKWYLLTKASLTRYYQEQRLAILLSEGERITDQDDESDEDGNNYMSDSHEGSENVEIGSRPTERDPETMSWNGWNGENFEGGGETGDSDMIIDLEEADGNWKDDSMGEQVVKDGDGEGGGGFEGSNLNAYSLSADDTDIFKEFFDFSNYSDAS